MAIQVELMGKERNWGAKSGAFSIASGKPRTRLSSDRTKTNDIQLKLRQLVCEKFVILYEL